MCPEKLLFSLLMVSALLPVALSLSTLLPPEEIEALKRIAEVLNKTYWNFSVDPCSQEAGWVSQNFAKGKGNVANVRCSNCNSDGSICHVTSIVLKEQKLVGILPREMALLPFLQEIDLTRNFLSGTIPDEWATLPLVNFSLRGNSISGQIPSWIGKITTLQKLVLEANRFTGPLPKELGYLRNLTKIEFSANGFSGELPDTFSNLTNLLHFQIGSNNFSGKIPQFLENWTQIRIMDLQASGLQGPIPTGVSLLKNLNDLRISDITGNFAFPQLEGMQQLQYLILRNCGITGEIPSFVNSLSSLNLLDLSYNVLSGIIPSTFGSLNHVNFIFLTSNNLSGSVPDWILNDKNDIDLSYNNCTFKGGNGKTCQLNNINFLGNIHKDDDQSEGVPCLETIPCNGENSAIYINCGGEEVTINHKTYEQDSDNNGVSTFRLGTNWAVSSTGSFLDSSDKNNFIATAKHKLSMPNSELYKDARITPLSLTYFGLCLSNGNYSVKLHFSEIIFSDYNGHASPGRRMFDVYIQGGLVLKDFNIRDEANGSEKAIIKTFPAVVTRKTLEIRFHWAGRGTTTVPMSGSYGPLISAISVESAFEPPSKSKRFLIGITFAAISAAVLIFVAWKKGYFRCKDAMDTGSATRWNCNSCEAAFCKF